MLRGPSKDVLNEVQRNLQDAMNVVRNLYLDPRILPGGGAVEMALHRVSLFTDYTNYLKSLILMNDFSKQ